jgi:hypothetical protein
LKADAAADYARRRELQARTAEEPFAEAAANAAQQAKRRACSARGRAELARKVAIDKAQAAGCHPSCQPVGRSSCWIRGELEKPRCS